MTPLEELALLLRPAGGGLYLVSTGRAEQEQLQKRVYDASTMEGVETRFRQRLEEIKSAKAFVLGIPSDVGAGFRRGANLGPIEMRLALLDAMPDFPERLARHDVIDLGDVFVVPQLLHDEMLSESQKERSRAALYPHVAPGERAAMPVSPLSIAERALDLVFALNPTIKPFALGGDHSTAWPVFAALAKANKEKLGIVQPDAHTDLLAERLGVKYCFATWSYHANEVLGRQGRLVQVGTRASRHEKAHWETNLGVKQFWAEECLRQPEETIDALMAHLKAAGVERVYFSNDIDGTDAEWAQATGTPETGGLTPDFLVQLIRRLGKETTLVGADIMEVAPVLQDHPDSKKRTLDLATRYTRETLSALIGSAL